MDEQYAVDIPNMYTGQIAGGLAKSIRSFTITESLEYKKKNLENELKQVNEALEALNKNPEIERVMNLVKLAL